MFKSKYPSPDANSRCNGIRRFLAGEDPPAGRFP
jgi:hypothetical protein